MARSDKGGGGVSLEPEDMIEVGLFGPGPATIVESVFAEYDYGGNKKGVPVWLITYEREGEKYEQPYSVGNGWRVSPDGDRLIPKNGQTGIPTSSNAGLLLASLRKAGTDGNGKAIKGAIQFPAGLLKNGDPRALEGMEVVLVREAQPDRGLDTATKKDGPARAPRTILLVEEITALPGESGKKSSGKKKIADDDDEDEDEAPKKKGGKASSKAKDEDEDDDDDEAPARGKKGAKGKAKDDEDEVSEEDAVEVFIETLEANDGEIEIDDIELLVKKQRKGEDDQKAMAAFCATDDFIALEKGWTVNAKKRIVTLDDK